jgi:hypothetical protein
MASCGIKLPVLHSSFYRSEMYPRDLRSNGRRSGRCGCSGGPARCNNDSRCRWIRDETPWCRWSNGRDTAGDIVMRTSGVSPLCQFQTLFLCWIRGVDFIMGGASVIRWMMVVGSGTLCLMGGVTYGFIWISPSSNIQACVGAVKVSVGSSI